LDSGILERFPDLERFEAVSGPDVLDGLPFDVQDVEANQTESLAAISLPEKFGGRVCDCEREALQVPPVEQDLDRVRPGPLNGGERRELKRDRRGKRN
jgi:hypothetical protein